MLYSNCMNPVALPPGRARLSTKPAPTGSATTGNTIGTVRVACSNGPTVEAPWARMTSGASAANSAACLRISAALAVAQRVSIRTLRPMVQPNCAAPAGTPRRGPEFRIVRGCGQEHADAPHPLGLLRARRERPRSRRAAEQRDELAASHHSITSSARASSDGGTVEAERLGGLEVDDQLVLGRRLHRQVGRLLALEDAVDVAGRLPVLVDKSGRRRSGRRRDEEAFE